jgi:hypothetical protein
MRAIAAIAALSLMAACGLVGPSREDAAPAVRDYFAAHAERRDAALAQATLTAINGCQPAGGFFTCVASFQTGDTLAAANIWIARAPGGGWRLQNIAVREDR